MLVWVIEKVNFFAWCFKLALAFSIFNQDNNITDYFFGKQRTNVVSEHFAAFQMLQ